MPLSACQRRSAIDGKRRTRTSSASFRNAGVTGWDHQWGKVEREPGGLAAAHSGVLRRTRARALQALWESLRRPSWRGTQDPVRVAPLGERHDRLARQLPG